MRSLPIINILHLSKKFKNNFVIKNLTVDIFDNQILVVLGISGCGKSTLFKILLGIYQPDEGNIFYQGERIYEKKTGDILKRIVGFVSQENSFYENLTIYENLFFYGKVYGLKKDEIKYRIEYLLDLVNLSYFKDVLSDKISGGMKRRLELAISLIHDPEILILDEPFTGLDVILVDEIWNLILKIKNSGVTVILSTHNLNNLELYVDRFIILDRGNLKYDSIEDENSKQKSIEKTFQDMIY